MKYKIEKLNFGKIKPDDEEPTIMYIVQCKKHWWSRWTYIMDEKTQVPKLYSESELPSTLVEEFRNFMAE